MIFISRVDGEKSTPEGLCLKCAMEMNIGPIKQMMESMGITEEDLDAMSEQLGGMFGGENGEDFEPGGAGTFPFMQGLMDLNLQPGEMSETQGDGTPEQEETLPAEAPDAAQQTKTKRSRSKEKKKIKRKYLDAYCTNLTQRAKDGQIDRIIGRDREIYRVVQILCRRTKNNPCLIGEPGVGKTAIAEGLALRMANGEVPARLADKELHLLDLTALVAGTQFRGQFESRIKGLIEEVKQNGNIILFIDEVHNLVGTGDAEGSMNAANILKPALSRGEIQVIGATTFNEYRKNIEKDAALERRFQPVKVEEPSIEDTYQMLMGIKSYYENYHHVQISDQLVRRAVVLSERYINDRFLPDKAIDLLDEACTCANLRNKAISDYQKKSNELQELKETEEDLMNDTEEMDLEEISRVRAEIVACESETNKLKPAADDNGVTEDDLANVIQLWTGIPASKVIESDLRRLAGLENTLKSKVIGQDEAVALVSAAIRRSVCRSARAVARLPLSSSALRAWGRQSWSSSLPTSCLIRRKRSSAWICPSLWRSTACPASSVLRPAMSAMTRRASSRKRCAASPIPSSYSTKSKRRIRMCSTFCSKFSTRAGLQMRRAARSILRIP